MNYPECEWRLLITPPSTGAWNMAADEAILESVDQMLAPPTLRLYSWQPPCLSIGYAQPTSDINFDRLNSMHWDWVRRPTGGRAILHTDELTYSVVAPSSDPRVSGGVLESYQRLSAALMTALHNLSVPAKSLPNDLVDPAQRNAPICFEVPSNYEIIVQGKKLVGSAQARRKNMVLQHGTLPLTGDLTRITTVLSYDDEQARQVAATRLLAHATTLELILSRFISFEEAAQVFVLAFEAELNLKLVQANLTQPEELRADQLVGTKYANPDWLMRI